MCCFFFFCCIWPTFVLAFRHNFYADSCNSKFFSVAAAAIVNYRSNSCTCDFDLPARQIFTNKTIVCFVFNNNMVLLLGFIFILRLLSYISCVQYYESMNRTLPLSFNSFNSRIDCELKCLHHVGNTPLTFP